MPIRWDNSPVPEVFQVLQHVLGAPIFIIAGADRSFERRHDLHWLPEQRRGVPCTHEDCPWHKLPLRTQWWLPCLAYSNVGRCWKQKVLPITWGMREFLEEPREGIVWQFERRGRANAPVVWNRCERMQVPQPFAGFNVENSILTIWGMYAKMKNTRGTIRENGPRLFEAEDGSAAAG